MQMTTRTIGLVVAMSAEATAVTGRRQPVERVVEVSPRVHLRVGGVGAQAAERSCAALVEAGASALASVGFAAGLSPICDAGRLVAPAEILSSNGEILSVDTAWLTALKAAIPSEIKAFGGQIAEVESVIGPEEKRALHRRTGADAADMESAAVVQFAARNGLPTIALRVVFDGLEEEIPPAFVADLDRFGRPHYGALLSALLGRPGDALCLARLHKNFRCASRVLSRVIDHVGVNLRCP